MVHQSGINRQSGRAPVADSVAIGTRLIDRFHWLIFIIRMIHSNFRCVSSAACSSICASFDVLHWDTLQSIVWRVLAITGKEGCVTASKRIIAWKLDSIELKRRTRSPASLNGHDYPICLTHLESEKVSVFAIFRLLALDASRWNIQFGFSWLASIHDTTVSIRMKKSIIRKFYFQEDLIRCSPQIWPLSSGVSCDLLTGMS